jgi:ankyrin repeat protein
MSIWHTDLGLTTEDILANLVQYQDSKGLSALHLACIKGHAGAVDVLMKLGANPFAVVSRSAQADARHRELVLTGQQVTRAQSMQYLSQSLTSRAAQSGVALFFSARASFEQTAA